MNLSQLQTFCTVCQCLSFTEAATKLCISQPAVSRQISALEAEIGTALFQRIHSTIVLTPAGNFLREQLPDTLAMLQETLKEAKRIGNGETGRLHVGLLEDQSLDHTISAALRQLQTDRIYLRIQRFDFRSLEAALLRGDLDVAISIQQGSHAFPDCAFHAYAKEAMCFAVRQDALPASLEQITTDFLRSYPAPLLIPSLDSFQPAQLQELTDLSSHSDYFCQEYDFSSISPMVAAGLAATVANETHILSLDRTVRLVPLTDMASIQKGVFWSDKNHNPAISRLLRLLGDDSVHSRY
jgi:DNA-binding transcriptional LysR family regulator